MMNKKHSQRPPAAHSPMEEHLEEQFGQMRGNEPAPEVLKEEVFNTLDTINLLADVVDLFTLKFGQTEVSFLDLFQAEHSDDKEG